MQFKNEWLWTSGRDKMVIEFGHYGEANYRYAKKWAELMEARMAEGVALGDCAMRTAEEADDGITGLMYTTAVSLLNRCWVHGDALRRWHNLNVQVGREGIDANANGSVLHVEYFWNS